MYSNKFLLFSLVFILSIYITRSQQNGQRVRGSNYQNVRKNESNNSNSGSDESDRGLIQKILDKLTNLAVVDQTKLQRLEAIEARIERIESTILGRTEALETELREVTRRVETVDFLATKIESTLELIRIDIEEIKHTQQPVAANHNKNNGNLNSISLDDKLSSLAILITSTRTSLHRIERELQNTGKNLTEVIASNKEISQFQKTLPTTQVLNSALLGLKNQPIYAVVQTSNNSGRTGITSTSNNGSNTTPTSCLDVPKKSGAYKIQLDGSMIGPFYVYCDMENNDGGWTVIQSRLDGQVNFYRNWLEYKHGFGNLGGEFWIGLDKLHELTSSKLHEIIITMRDLDGVTQYARYSSFAIGGEKESYALILLGKYSGTAGDSLLYHGGQKFSTYDNDNDAWPEGNCAQAHVGAWWYNACDMSNLNGRYLSGDVPEEMAYHGIYWSEFRGNKYSLASTKIMIRPIE